MPIYGFECGSCGHRFDRLQKLSDADPAECPECGVADIRRQLTAPQFRLSGSGWYETDFKKGGDSRRNLSDKPDAGTGAAESSGSAEKAAPAAASEKSPAPASKTETTTKPAATPAAPSSGSGN